MYSQGKQIRVNKIDPIEPNRTEPNKDIKHEELKMTSERECVLIGSFTLDV